MGTPYTSNNEDKTIELKTDSYDMRKTPNFFMEQIQLLFLHPKKLEEMKAGALAFAKPLAARAVAREILEFLMLD